MFLAIFYAMMTGWLVFVGLLFSGVDGIRADWFSAVLCWVSAYVAARLFLSELKEMDNEHRRS